MESSINKWTGYTIAAAVLGAIVVIAFQYIALSTRIMHKPLAPFVLCTIGAVLGVVVVQILHKKRDPFSA